MRIEQRARKPRNRGIYQWVSVHLPNGGWRRIRSLSYRLKGKEKRFRKADDPIRFKRKSKSSSTVYIVSYILRQRKWVCSCPSFRYKTGTDGKGYCKHIREVVKELGISDA